MNMTNRFFNRVLRVFKNPKLRPIANLLKSDSVRRSENPYATHLPVLIGLSHLKKVERVVELGCGEYSTPTFLDTAVFPHLQRLDSFENVLDWADRIAELTKGDDRVSINRVMGPMSSIVSRIRFQDYDLVFVDDSVLVEDRAQTIAEVSRCRSAQNVVIIHDFETRAYRDAASTFSHRFVSDALMPNTGILWDLALIDRESLQRLNQSVRKYSANISPEDRQSWITIMNKQNDR